MRKADQLAKPHNLARTGSLVRDYYMNVYTGC